MNIEELTIREAREIASAFGNHSNPNPRKSYGLSIVVADRGFVYVGLTSIEGDMCNIENCRNIRYWGTENGLQQLVNDGPTSKSKIDDAMKLVALPLRAVISIHPVEAKSWKKLF